MWASVGFHKRTRSFQIAQTLNLSLLFLLSLSLFLSFAISLGGEFYAEEEIRAAESHHQQQQRLMNQISINYSIPVSVRPARSRRFVGLVSNI